MAEKAKQDIWCADILPQDITGYYLHYIYAVIAWKGMIIHVRTILDVCFACYWW